MFCHQPALKTKSSTIRTNASIRSINNIIHILLCTNPLAHPASTSETNTPRPAGAHPGARGALLACTPKADFRFHTHVFALPVKPILAYFVGEDMLRSLSTMARPSEADPCIGVEGVSGAHGSGVGRC